MFKDVFNPTVSEIRHWAYSDQLCPEQDWDLYILHDDNLALFLELAADDQCAAQGFFKHMIYLYVAEGFRTEESHAERKVKLQYCLYLGLQFNGEVIEQWKRDIAKLFKSHFLFFSYEKWMKKATLSSRFSQ